MVDLVEILEESPIIAAVKDIKDLDKALSSRVGVIFMLCGSILNIESAIRRIKRSKKRVCIHVDFVEGLGKDGAAVEFLKIAGADGIITTKPSLIKDAMYHEIFAIQRLFIFDSRSLETGLNIVMEDKPNAVEIMPGIATKVIGKIHDVVKIPVIAGGLIFDRSDVIDALSKGAIGVSTSDSMLWEE
jgi:glycerol uptake operon antiterminator